MPINTPEKDTISIIWHVDDILHERPELTKDQARTVLHSLEHNHDADIGINWDVIACTASLLFPDG